MKGTTGPSEERDARFEHVLAAAGRALGGHAASGIDWNEALHHAARRSPQTSNRGRVAAATVAPLSELSENEFRRLRGRVDALALHARYHDAGLDDVQTGAAETLLAALEEVRVQALGARVMPGVASNLREALQADCRERGFHMVQHRHDVPLTEAIAFHVRAIIAPATVPDAAAPLLAAWSGVLDPLTRDLAEALAMHIADQRCFMELCITLVARLGEIVAEVRVPAMRPGVDAPMLRAEDLAASEMERESLSATVPFAGSRGMASVSVDRRTPSQRVRTQLDQGGVSDGRADFGVVAAITGTEYRVFDASCDVVREAVDLRGAEELVRLRHRLDDLVVHHHHLVARLANRLRRSLLAREKQDWVRDLDEGGLDTSRLARAVIDPGNPLSYRQQREAHTRDTVVSLLIDNSGSMSGTPIETAAVCADILARTLERCGVRSEVLGFTTASWKGGQPRERWEARQRPPHPGRLNELLHIVYKPADMSWRRARDGLGLMLDGSMLKENVDGEALLWAHQRLLARQERRRILIVISDGEPSDESTRDANVPGYLENHLRRVIATIENRSPVQLLAIGVAHDVGRYYRHSVTIDEPGQLGDALARQLVHVLDEGATDPGCARSVAVARWRASRLRE